MEKTSGLKFTLRCSHSVYKRYFIQMCHGFLSLARLLLLDFNLRVVELFMYIFLPVIGIVVGLKSTQVLDDDFEVKSKRQRFLS